MSENENVLTIEDFMGSYSIVPMKNAREEGLMSFDVCKKRILELTRDLLLNNSLQYKNHFQLRWFIEITKL